MAQLLARPCSTRGCRGTVRGSEGKYCGTCKTAGKARETRPNAAERGYNRSWQSYRIRFLNERRFCEDPVHKEAGEVVQATRVDHIIPHRGKSEVFWDVSNHQALCESCHNRKTATFDGGFGRKISEPIINTFLKSGKNL